MRPETGDGCHDRDVSDACAAQASSPTWRTFKLNFPAWTLLKCGARNGAVPVLYRVGVQQSSGCKQKSFNYPTHDGVVAWNGRLPGKFIACTRVGVVDRYASDRIRL
jgi:hypothetical protein